jgi:PKD repeat protein
LARAKTYAAPGTYTIRLTITDRNGGRGVQTFTVTVN